MQQIFVEEDLEKKSQLLILVNNFDSTILNLLLGIILFVLTRTVGRQKSGVAKVPNRLLGLELTPFIPLITMAVPLVGKLPTPSLLLPCRTPLRCYFFKQSVPGSSEEILPLLLYDFIIFCTFFI